MSSKPYRSRLVDELLAAKLRSTGAVLVQGPKACGKTTTAKQQAASALLLGSPRTLQATALRLSIDPAKVLAGAPPMLIDEWQVLPVLWDEVRSELDERNAFGQFILTGSAVPADRSDIRHTGTGRYAWLTMRPMSLYESGASSGLVSLRALFEGRHEIYAEQTFGLDAVAALLCRGGWPASLELAEEDALEYVRSYFDAVVEQDIVRLDGIRRSPERLRALLKSYARSTGSQAAAGAIRADIADEREAETLSEKTINAYIRALKGIFVVEEAASWHPSLCSKTAIRSSPTRYFVDPSLAAVALGVGPADLENDLETFGLLFENLCVRDLRVYGDVLGADLFHYRDRSDLECDAVLHRRDGHYGLVEIKLGGKALIEQGAATLKALVEKIDTTRMPKPSFLMVLTAVGDFAYRRPEDGVLVVPIGCLGP